MLGETEVPSGFAFAGGWWWVPRVRTEQLYGTSLNTCYNLWREREREALLSRA